MVSRLIRVLLQKGRFVFGLIAFSLIATSVMGQAENIGPYENVCNYASDPGFQATLYYDCQYATPFVRYGDASSEYGYTYHCAHNQEYATAPYYQQGKSIRFGYKLESEVCNDEIIVIYDDDCRQLASATLYHTFVSTTNGKNYIWAIDFFDNNTAGEFSIRAVRRKRYGLGCLWLDFEEITNRTFCKVLPTNQFPGSIETKVDGVTQSDNPEIPISSGTHTLVDFSFVNGFNNCDAITEINIINGSASLPSGMTYTVTGTTTLTVAIPNNDLTNLFGTYSFELSATGTSNRVYSSKLVSFDLVPACADDNLPTVSVTGSDVETVAPGYSNNPSDLGGYILQELGQAVVDFDAGDDIADFSTYYDVFHNGGADGSNTADISVISAGEGEYDVTINPGVTFGSYQIEAIKKVQSGSGILNDCQSYGPVNIFVGGSNVILETVPCLVTLPNQFDDVFPMVSTDFGENYVLEHFVYSISSNQGIIIKPGMTLKAGATLMIETVPDEIPEEAPDDDDNWVKKKAYNDYGEIIAESKQYYDNRGSLIQSQSKNMDAGYVMAQQSVYDRFGRLAVNSLSAPVREASLTAAVDECGSDIQNGSDMYFLFQPRFMSVDDSDPVGLPFSYSDFDLNTGNPVVLKKNKELQLGWYYSANNDIESGVPETNYPFSRTVFYDDGTPEEKTQIPPGNVYRNGPGHQHVGISNQPQPVLSGDIEIVDYLALRSELLLPSSLTLENNGYIKSVTDPHGVVQTSYFDNKDNLIITIVDGSIRSYRYFNLSGQLVASISPNGVKAYKGGENYVDIDKTTYEYDPLGALISSTSVDGGKSTFKNSIDGRIRFSQNALQEKDGIYSYANYDPFLRVVESGVYDPGDGGDGVLYADIDDVILKNLESDGGLTGGSKSEQSRIYYDGDNDPTLPIAFNQTFVRGSISATEKVLESQTWFSYDERGRVISILIHYENWGAGTTKRVDYKYGQVGEVKEIAYQKGQSDAFYHVYQYNISGGLDKVYTSTEAPVYNEDDKVMNGKLQASYFYYIHGPLKRVEMASMQGVDYVYTIEGRLKSINHPDRVNKDPGADTGEKEDIFGMQLEYYNGDYLSADNKVSTITTSTPTEERFDGNIRLQSFATKDNNGGDTKGYKYSYDNRNQLTSAVFGGLHFGYNKTNTYFSTASTLLEYNVSNIKYDDNGNILGLHRRDQSISGAQAEALHDFSSDYDYPELGYNYPDNSNRLSSIYGYSSYDYDEIGQTTKEDITGAGSQYYDYNTAGLVKGVYSDISMSAPIMEYEYDENGFLIHKLDHGFDPPVATWYVRDASGNALSVYDNNDALNSIVQVETPVYGKGKLGVHYHQSDETIYELSDHIGNVRATFGAQYLPIDVSGSSWTELNDGRVSTTGGGKIKVKQSNTKSGFGGKSIKYNGGQFAFTTIPNTRYKVSVEVAKVGSPSIPLSIQVRDNVNPDNQIYGKDDFNVGTTATSILFEFSAQSSSSVIWLFNPANEKETFLISSIIVEKAAAQIESYADYYPFGLKMEGRTQWISPTYRTGYQGEFAEDEMDEIGKINFQLRKYDPVIGRWISTDPAGQYWSPYLAMGNNPINLIDEDGDSTSFANEKGELLVFINDDDKNRVFIIKDENIPEFSSTIKDRLFGQDKNMMKDVEVNIELGERLGFYLEDAEEGFGFISIVDGVYFLNENATKFKIGFGQGYGVNEGSSPWDYIKQNNFLFQIIQNGSKGMSGFISGRNEGEKFKELGKINPFDPKLKSTPPRISIE